MKNKNRTLHPDEPLLHDDHPRPVTRRDFLKQGFISGSGIVMGPSIFSLLASSNVHAALSPDLEALKASCNIADTGAGKIPFICFDLAGGANFSGSNILVGGPAGQLDFLTAAGYSKLGLPGDMLPNSSTTNFVNTDLGLAFHSDSAILRGIQARTTATTHIGTNGAIIPARSDNDTGNNPHNPMYGINKAGADGALLTLIGSRNSVSGGNSMSPAAMIKASALPTKIDRPSDVTGLVDTGKLVGLLSKTDAVKVMEAVERISAAKLGKVSTGLSKDAEIKRQVDCAYVKSADLVDRYGNPDDLAATPADDAFINQIFPQADFDSDREYRKTAAVMKMVIKGYAGAGTISMGGYDYHTGNRSVGEQRDFRAGECIGACLEYAQLEGKPLMLYVFSDGSVASNGMTDDSTQGRGKGVWTGDNSSTASSFFLVYNPGGRPVLFTGDGLTPEQHQQLGWFRSNASVETAATPAANNVNLLVETVILNYMALHGEQAQFGSLFDNQGIGNSTMQDRMTAFNPII